MTRLPRNPADGAERTVRRDEPARAHTATSSNRRSWPVLARIGDAARGDIARAEERGTRSEKIAATRTLRVDKPHVTVELRPVAPAMKTTAAANTETPKPKKNNVDVTPRRPTRYLHRLPTILRIAIRTYFVLSPYRSLIRAAVMFVLMAITGASTMIMVGGRLQPEQVTPPSTNSAAMESPPIQATTNPGEEESAIKTASPAETATPPESPTALGPTSAGSRELVAIEATADEVAATGDAIKLGPLPLHSPPIMARPIAVTAIPENPTTSTASLPYPVTPYAAITFPVANGSLPRVQTGEPPAAVAKFEGTLESIPPR